LIEVILRN